MSGNLLNISAICNFTASATNILTPLDPPYKAETFHVIPRPDRFLGAIKDKETYHLPVKGCNGLAYEADHVAQQLRAGVTESELMTFEESRVVQRWFDQVRTVGPTKTAGLRGGV